MPNSDQHLLFILDRSGSMSSRAGDVIGSFNTLINDTRADAERDGIKTLVSLVTFADSHQAVFGPLPISEVFQIDSDSYRPGGMTALLDTVFDNVTSYRDSVGQGKFGTVTLNEAPAIVVVVMTDGHENASTRANWQQVQDLVAECESLGNWTFTYVGAHAGAWDQANAMRFSSGNVLDAHSLSVAESIDRLATGLRSNRAEMFRSGVKNTKNLYQPDHDDATKLHEPATP